MKITLPLKKLPRRITIELAATSIFRINTFSKIVGISAELCLGAIILLDIIEYKQFFLQLGYYVHMHEPYDNNTGLQWNMVAVSLRPSGNSQGGYNGYSLNTGNQLNRKMCTPCPIPAEFIYCVYFLHERNLRGFSFPTGTICR